MEIIDRRVTVKDEVHAWEFPGYNREAFEAKIETANNRLARAGLDARFRVAHSDFTVRENRSPRLPDGTFLDPFAWVEVPWVRAELTGPLRLAHGHYTFVASLVPEEAGMTVHSAPGQELGGYRPKGDDSCDHCGTNRNRTRLYLVRDERDGSIIQLGHSCIELYTGIVPRGLWALTFDADLSAIADERDDYGWGRVRQLGADIDYVIALAWVTSSHGRAYISVSQDWDGSTPTSRLVKSYLFDPPKPNARDNDREYNAYLAAIRQAGRVLEEQPELIAAIKASHTTVAADSDYGSNLRVVLAGESGWVSDRNIGVVASLVKVFAREQELEEKRKANPAQAGYLADVGTRVRDFTITLTTVKQWEGGYGWTTLLVGRTGDGHVVKWFASGQRDVEIGDTLSIKAATVKSHEVYQDTDQTVITRAKIG